MTPIRNGPGALAGATEADNSGYEPQNSAVGGGLQPSAFPDGWLFKEFADDAARANRPEVRQWLAGHGVPADMLCRGGCALVGAGRIEIVAEPYRGAAGLYQPDPDGVPAALVAVTEIGEPIRDDDGGGLDPLDCLVDIVAWLPNSPDRLYLRTGDADILGIEAVRRAYELDRPLIVHRSPAEWLKGHGAGCCILDWRKPLPMLLHNCRRIICGDKTTLGQLRRGLKVDVPDVRLLQEAANDR